MFHYAIGMLPLTEKVQAEHRNTVSSFFVDDLTLGARTCPFAKSFSTVNWYGPSIIRCGGCKVLRHLHGSRWDYGAGNHGGVRCAHNVHPGALICMWFHRVCTNGGCVDSTAGGSVGEGNWDPHKGGLVLSVVRMCGLGMELTGWLTIPLMSESLSQATLGPSGGGTMQGIYTSNLWPVGNGGIWLQQEAVCEQHKGEF